MKPERWHVRLDDGAILHFDAVKSADTAARALVGEPIELFVSDSGMQYRGPSRMVNVVV